MRAWSLAVSLGERLLDLLSPQSCAACARPWAGSAFCQACGLALPPSAPADIDGVPLLAGALYADPVAAALQRFKYACAPELARPLAALVRPRLTALGVEAADVWVPVPLHALRLAERGYNQSALLARELCRGTCGRVAPRLLRRVRVTAQQARLSRRAREANTDGAFQVGRRGGARRVLLVDDVLTTGATVRACIGALRQAGLLVVGCVVVACARAPHELDHERR